MNRRELLAGMAAACMARLVEGEPFSMDQRISVVTLGVRDVETARRFYADGLGWKPVYEDKSIVFFQAGCLIFALFARDELAKDFDGNAAAFGRAAISLGHNARARDEVDLLIAKAASAGAKILKPASQKPWGGYSGYFADPDGFAWEVAWNPAWPITADGAIHYQ